MRDLRRRRGPLHASGQERPGRRRRERRRTLGIFLLCAAVYWVCPVHTVADSQYQLLAAETLIRTGQLGLEGTLKPPLPLSEHPGLLHRTDLPYQLARSGARIVQHYPPGSTILAVPFMAAISRGGLRPVLFERYSRAREERLEGDIAALVTALLVTIIYRTARLWLPPAPATLVALASAFGTSLFPTASRTLWPDTWGVLLLGAIIHAVARQATGRGTLSAPWLGTLLALSFLVKPTYAASIAPVLLYAAVSTGWRKTLPTVTVLLTWGAAFATWSASFWGSILPPYYHQHVSTSTLAEGLAGLLVSPSRGLLVFSPIVAWLIIRVARNFGRLPHPGLALLAVLASSAHLIVAGGYPVWWGGHCYGPRYTLPMVPWLSLLATLALAPAAMPAPGRRLPALLLCLSVLANGRGAFDPGISDWNYKPTDVDASPGRVWDWRYPQAFAGVLPMPEPEPYPRLDPGQYLNPGGPEIDAYFWKGFASTNGTQSSRTTTAKEATFLFAFPLRHLGPNVLLIEARPYLSPPTLLRQRLTIELNGTIVGKAELNDDRQLLAFPIAEGVLLEKNRLVLRLPDATAPADLGPSKDKRKLGLELFRIEIQRQPRRPAVG